MSKSLDEASLHALIANASRNPDGVTVVGWADDAILAVPWDRVTVDITREPDRPDFLGEDEVLLVAIRPPYGAKLADLT